jgi:hypothetical protein
MKSLMLLWQVVLNELGTWCDTSTTLDSKRAERRFEHEGLSFLTITLPSFGTDLQKGLERGKVDHDLWNGFHFSGGLPQFLGGFLDLVFDRRSGLLLDEPSIDAIFALRQLSLMFKRIELPCSDARENAAMQGFVKCEQELKAKTREWNAADYSDFSRVSKLLFAETFSKIDEDIYYDRVFPKHGPGKTADRVRNNARFNFSTWTDRLEKIFRSVDFIIPSARYFPLLEDVQFLEPGHEIPVRVVSVPKTLKTPRIIAIEPAHMMYVQQSILECFMEHWRRDDILHSFLGFDDQLPNQLLAQKGSFDKSLATLDLSEASDRVSNQLVREMLRPFRHMFDGVDACRSRKADVLGHGVVRLSKFASMGSALTFPMEACVFLTCIFLGIEKELNKPLTKRLIKSFLGKVRVFGDDIIIPVEYVSSVVESLEHFGAKVNRNKSYWNGEFRESCGGDFYAGLDVTPVKCNMVLPTQLQHAEEILAMSAMRNQFYQLGLWQTCTWLDRRLSRVLRGRYPIVESSSSVIGRHSIFPPSGDGWNDRLHVPIVKGYVAVANPPIDLLDGPGALLKFFLKRGDHPYQEGHLERAGRPDAVNLKLRWTSPF